MTKDTNEDIAKFTLNNKVYVIRIDLRTQYQLIEKFDFNILKLFLDEDATRTTMLKLLLDTEFCIDLMWFFIEKKVDFNKDALLDYIGTAANLEEFKESVWAAIVAFSSPLTRQVLLDMWKQLKHELKTYKIDFETSLPSSSEQKVEV